MIVREIFACLMLLFFSFYSMPLVTVFAQDQASGDEHQPPSTEDIVAKMQTKLNLTQDQVTAITPIIQKYSDKRGELRQSMEDGTADRDSIRSQMKELKTDENQEMSQILSADQMTQWKQMMGGQHRHQHSGDGGNAGGSWASGGGNGEGGGNGT